MGNEAARMILITRTGREYKSSTLFTPDFTAGYDYLQHFARQGFSSALHKLFFEALETGIRDCLHAENECRYHDHLEAMAWLRSDHESPLYPFGFRSICSALGLSATWLRKSVLAAVANGVSSKVVPNVNDSWTGKRINGRYKGGTHKKSNGQKNSPETKDPEAKDVLNVRRDTGEKIES